jgi:hypothetical protein
MLKSITMFSSLALRRARRHVAPVLLVLSTLFAFAADGAPVPGSPEERLFLAANQVRSQQGLGSLKWDDSLAAAARGHAQLIAQNGQLSHQYSGEADVAARAAQAGAHFQAIAENIALGPTTESIQSQWMKSMPHRTNILDPNLNAIGFAVAERGGYLYAVADFERSVPSLTLEQVEDAVGRVVTARGLRVTGPRLDARQTCEMAHGTAGGSNPRFVVRWQSADALQLPGALEERLRSGQYQSAAVGACASSNPEQGFTTYRVAVLLY